MKIKYNPETGSLKVRPSLGTILGIGITLAGAKIVYDFTTASYIVTLRRLHPKLEQASEWAKAQRDEAEVQVFKDQLEEGGEV